MQFNYKIVFIQFLVLLGIPGYSQCPDGYTSAGTERAVNGTFDSGNSGFTSSYTYEANSSDPSVRTELWNEGTYSVYNNPYELHSNFANNDTAIATTGNMMIINGSKFSNVSVWQEVIAVSPSTLYYFVTDVASVYSTSPAKLQFSVNGVLLGSIFNATSTVLDWNKFYATWNSSGSASATISIVNQNTAASGNDFALDNISFIPCSLVLPVELTMFTVSQNNCDTVVVAWQTVSETNNNYFSIERSTDGNTFESIGIIKSKTTNSNSTINYSFIDNNPTNGIAYYRLKQTDIDGGFKYSNVVSFQRCISNKNIEVTVFPNPTYRKITVDFIGNPKDIESVNLINVYGETVYESTFLQPELDFENLNSGVYILRVALKSKEYIEKRFIVK